jgi:hypothetical protein
MVANKMAGNKKDNVTVIYTPWSNLKKDGSMAVGQVGFKDQKKVCICHCLSTTTYSIICTAFIYSSTLPLHVSTYVPC